MPRRFAVLCSALAALGLALTGCTEAPKPQSGQPTFYANLGNAGSRVDAATARAMISAYRMNNGLAVLTLDPALVQAAQAEADIMAAADKPSSADAIKAKLAARGLGRTEVNLSAGYRTLAEAFSGWRDSPQHDKVMKTQGATRMGIATAYAPGSKYKVYWALVIAP
jgi:uncharacterized protein YkwD